MERFCLALPAETLDRVRSITKGRGVTVTAYIRTALNARLQADITGRRYCSTGEPCTLNFLPDPRQFAMSQFPGQNVDTSTKNGG